MGKEILVAKPITSFRTPEEFLATTERIGTYKEFLEKLYDRVAQYLVGNGGQIKQNFSPQHVKEWDYINSDQSYFIPLSLIKAVHIQDSKKNSFLVLGCLDDDFRSEDLRLQFGFSPRNHERRNFSSINQLRELIQKSGSADFYLRPNGKLEISCWTNEWINGGNEIENLPEWMLLTTDGLERALDIIARSIHNLYGEDLT